MGHKGFAVVTILFLVLAWRSWKDSSEAELRQASVSSTVSPAAVSRTTTTATGNSNTSQHANVEQTLHIVAEKWKSTDVNRDGLYNCIDAAVLFYQYYPDRSKVSIIINVNPKTGMNHLFNAVLINGSWIAIEPQAYATNHRSYWMKDIWGNQYDNSYNSVALDTYSRYVR
ncbi:MAG: hypothetical protein FWC19_10115 [Treponema sp.]|nr:hypothetical protein [Treponema sp.]MCL2273142.1 hypothetical protein [Treponema sp.]